MTYLATIDLPLDRLTPYPGNPRQGNVPVIEQSLKTNQQYRAIVVQATDPADPTKGGTILAGNHTWMAARNIGMDTIRAELHDVDDATARRIVAVDNRAADLGDYDDRLLAELLTGVEDLTGSGYDEADLDGLARSLDPPGLDELAEQVGTGEDQPKSLWPTVSVRVPPGLQAAWRAHVDTHIGDEVAALAAALDYDLDEP